MNKSNMKKILIGYLFLCTMLISIFVLINSAESKRNDYLVLITFMINLLIVIFNMLKKDYLGYSLDEMVYIFMLIFMVLAPWLQYISDKFPWYDTELITDKILVKSNLIITLFIFVYYITNKFRSRCLNRYELNSRKNKKFNNVEVILNITFLLSIITSLYIIKITGFNNLFSRETNQIIGKTSTVLILKNTFTAIPIITVTLNILYKKIYGYYYNKIKFIIVLFLCLFINFPTGLPRFKFAAIYIGLFLLIKDNFKNKYIFRIIIILGVLIVFPVINIFRYNSFSDLINLTIEIPNPVNDFLAGDFDSYSMLSRTIIYVNQNSITWGSQLMGVLLFFIPRSIWIEKPIGTGAMIGKFYRWEFTNVSCPFIGEGYINFGVFGVILFALILGIITAKLDNTMISYKKNFCKEITVYNIMYPFMLGFLFFVLRGDLLSSFSYIIGFLIPLIGLYMLDRSISIFKCRINN